MYWTIKWVVLRCNFIADRFWSYRFINFIRFRRHGSVCIVWDSILSTFIILFLFVFDEWCFNLCIFFANRLYFFMKLTYRISLTYNCTHLFHLGLPYRRFYFRLFLNWICSNFYRWRHFFRKLWKLNGSTKSKIFSWTIKRWNTFYYGFFWWKLMLYRWRWLFSYYLLWFFILNSILPFFS
jgi:hypothetical protein